MREKSISTTNYTAFKNVRCVNCFQPRATLLDTFIKLTQVNIRILSLIIPEIHSLKSPQIEFTQQLKTDTVLEIHVTSSLCKLLNLVMNKKPPKPLQR